MAAASEPTPQDTEYECPVCLQTCIHPVRLPCSHIFCFLCIKGVANQSKRCAMCRKEIPADFLENPDLVEKDIDTPKDRSEEYHWFYEGRGRNGWWQYDERTSSELEKAYTSKEPTCEILVAGFLYIIDFEKMVQRRRNEPSIRRRIKRDYSSADKKGIAGIKTSSSLEDAVPPLPLPSTDNTYSPCLDDDFPPTNPRRTSLSPPINEALQEISRGLHNLSVVDSPQYYPLEELDLDAAEEDS